jgi:hypothetical protein
MKFSLSGATFTLWFGGIWLVVGVPFLVLGLYFGFHEHSVSVRMKNEGAVATGMVLSKWIATNRSHGSGSNNTTTRSYWTSFRFQTGRGETVKGEAQVDERTWDSLIERRPIKVTYLADAPQQYRIEGEESSWILAFIFAGLGAVFTTVGGLVFARGVTHWRVTSRLRHSGTPADATVESVGPARITINGVQQMVVRYRYQDSAGRSRTGRSDPMSPEDADAWNAGDRGRIRFDAQLPQRSLWLGRDEG